MANILQLQRALNRIRDLDIVVKDIQDIAKYMAEILGETCQASQGDLEHVDRDRYSGKRTVGAIREYLKGKGGSATEEQIVNTLQTGGANLGTVPKRAVANGVSFAVKAGFLERRDGVVCLRRL